MTDNKRNNLHARPGRTWLKRIGILGALWFAAVQPLAASADGMETHGSPTKPNSLIVQTMKNAV